MPKTLDDMPKMLAVIPARAGSKGIPGKNYKLFNGKPLFIWSLLAAIHSKCNPIVISSNCFSVYECYKDFTNEYGSLISGIWKKDLFWLERPEEICTDTSSTEECLLHVAGHFPAAQYLVTLQPTSPLRRMNMIDTAFQKMIEQDKKSCMSARALTPLMVQKKDNRVHWHFDPVHRKMKFEFTEDEFFYHDDGALYITEREVLLTRKCRLDENPCIYANDRLYSIDIDAEWEWQLAEYIAKNFDLGDQDVC